MSTQFKTDAVMLYDVEPWNQLGFGVPTFGADNVSTLNRPIHGLTDEIGKIQLYIMTHIDASRMQPPSRNTIERIGKLCNRCQTVLAGRQKEYNERRLEPGHASPAALVWTIHPVPYFGSTICRNRWLREYSDMLMILLANAYQHSDNGLSLTVTANMARDLYQYVREIKLRMGTELLLLSMDEVADDSFFFKDEHYDQYAPDTVVTRLEAIDRPTSILHLPTEDDLHPLLVGIPATIVLPLLKQYPIGPIPGADGLTGQPLPEAEAAVGTVDGSAIGPASI
jgi:hypothetical protein